MTAVGRKGLKGTTRKGKGVYKPPSPEPNGHEPSLPENKQTDLEGFFEKDLRFEPRRSEAGVVSRIEETANKVADEIFGDADEALERFYASVRIPIYEVKDGKRVPKRDEKGRYVWQKDSFGNYEEDWTRLEGMEVERVIMTLQRVIIKATEETSRFYTQTVFYHNVQEDEYFAKYREIIDGTVNDRRANALRKTRDSRFFYLYVWMVWRRLNDKLEVLKNAQRTVEFQRHRYLKNASGKP